MSFWCLRCGKHDSAIDENQIRCPFCGVLLRSDAKKKDVQKGAKFYRNTPN